MSAWVARRLMQVRLAGAKKAGFMAQEKYQQILHEDS